MEDSKKVAESMKTYIFIATTAIGLTLYVHQTFATNARVDRIEKEQTNQQKISCLMALKLNVDKNDIKDICQLNIK